jgi:hypothetical protein
MREMKEVTIDVCGMELRIYPRSSVVFITKTDEDNICLDNRAQCGQRAEIPINVRERYNVSADEFIKDFQIKCITEYEKYF